MLSLFNDPRFSDVTIRQTFGGVRTDYHAHKSILCSGSSWFAKLFTEEAFKDSLHGTIAFSPAVKVENGTAPAPILEIFGDDPVYFEVLLNYIYTGAWSDDIAAKKQKARVTDAPLYFTNLIGVYGLADKYGVPSLCAHAVEQFPLFPEQYPQHRLAAHELKQLVRMHYSGGEREGVDKIGRQICAFMLRNGYGEYIKLVMFENLVGEFPKLAHDFFWAARNDNDGKLW